MEVNIFPGTMRIDELRGMEGGLDSRHAGGGGDFRDGKDGQI